MTTSWPRLWRGSLLGSLLGFGLLAFGLLGWLVAVLVGLDKEKSLIGISIAPLYVLSFGLGGNALSY
jgi:hypothetical protein